MSYQPQPPAGMPPQMYAPAPVQVPAAPPAKKGNGALLAGLGLLIVGVGAGAALIVLSGSTKEDTIKKFARAPVGCTTTLEFDKAATFTLFVETKGKVDDVGGDCTANGSVYDRGQNDLPDVTLALVDGDDNEITLDDASGPSYSEGAYAGSAIKQVRITDKGTYRLTVTSDATDFAIAVGGDPEGDAGTMKTAGIAAAAAGVVLGLLVIVLGRRKKQAPPQAPAWQQTMPPGGWPTQATVPGYQAPPPAPVPPSAPPYQQAPQAPPAPPAAPPGPGWGAPHQ